jgi:pimeloyl-ACP methyl ester carboxylesterase
VLALAATALLAPAALAADPPKDADWTQATIAETDGTQLHADIFRLKGTLASAKQPVILSIGPYFNHSGQTGPLGPVEDTPYDPVSGGPSDRFNDYIEGAKVLQRGYTWVQVDLRGFGGSSGCLDWAGPGEQADVKAAVEWAAQQPFSTGKVGMYGKSYDGVTGLIGIVQQPKGLAAVVAQEPVYDLYRYLYSNRVRYVNSLATPGLYNAIAGTPGTASDDLSYNFESFNDSARPGCPALNYADQQDPNHESAYWKPRDLIAGTDGKKTPLFLTQGLLENNTKPDGARDFWDGIKGPKRAWFGMWDHVRGNDKDGTGRLKMGRASWFDETMRFYDRYVAGKPASQAPVENDPPVALETNDGKWRGEAVWPPKDAYVLTAPLKSGTYSDDGTNNATGDTCPPCGEGIWTFSPPFAHDAELAGTPRITADVDAQSGANLVADIYDVDDKGSGVLFSRQAFLIQGPGKVSFDLYDQDWKIAKGHRLGVLVTGANADWWAHAPTGQQPAVKNASLALPFLACTRNNPIEGKPSIRLEQYLKSAPLAIDAATISQNTVASFPTPEQQRSCSAAERTGSSQCVDKRKFTFNIHQPAGGRITRATAYVNGKKLKTVRGRRVTRLILARLPKGKFTLKIVAQHASGKKTISVRKYRGCVKGAPTTIVRP